MKYQYRNINLELTNACTFSCSFCPNSLMTRKKEMLNASLIKKTVDYIAATKLTPLINYYVMGEPLLYPHLFEIIEYTKSKNIQVKLNTNGTLFNPEVNARLLQSNTDIIHISFYSLTKCLFVARNCRIIGLSFETWKKSIFDLLKKRIASTNNHTNVHLLFFKYSYLIKCKPREMNKKVFKNAVKKGIIELFDALNIPINSQFWKFMFGKQIIQRYSTSFKIKEGIYFDFIKFHNWGNIKEKKVHPAWFGSCDAFRDTFAILSNGDVSLCCADYNGELIVGNLYKECLRDILASRKVHKIIQCFKNNKLPFEKCRICRGGPNIFHWMKNQVASIINYNWNKP